MFDALYLKKNSDGSYDIIIYANKFDSEFANEFLSREYINGFKDKLQEIVCNKNIRIRAIKIILVGGLVLSISFTNVQKPVAVENKYAMSYVYFGSASDQIGYVIPSKNTISVVSPSYFNLNEDGSLALSNVNKNFIDSMHARNIKVVPFLSNHWDRNKGIIALDNIDSLVNDIVNSINEYNLDGINVDIENVTQLQRDKYTELVKKLRQSIPSDKEVSVAVAPNPNGWTNGWQGSYDYTGLAKYADHLFIMAYDEHYQNGEAGPIASIEFVEKSIEYALKYVDPNKIVLGIPFFGRIWADDGSVNGNGLFLDKAEDWIKRYNGVVTYDNIAKSPQVTFTIKETDAKPTLNGQILKAGTYTIWYENSDSIKQKLSLVNKYNLKGSGNWSAGQETLDVWDYYDLWLDAKYFSDISNHYAKDDIVKVSSDGIMKGMTDSTFAPMSSITRGQAATIAARVLELTTPDGYNSGLNDINKHWAKNEINAAINADILKGYPDGSFKPDVAMSREEIATMLSRMLSITTSNEKSPFIDVQEERWSYNEIVALANSGILLGYPDNTFHPEDNLTRGDMASLIERVKIQLDLLKE